ncbi:hypothetical protein AURDEDRAFT_182213 [Auricularia subglabra TFB-10046 SS5]|nr:hypothetical protein AURDEDRAFT_182213 [Auricularia subglabra TFB-10046 SS5]
MSQTASPASTPLPRSPTPPVQQPDSFDALIDLLAGDGPNEGLGRLSATRTGLRDADGNLDIGRIRSIVHEGTDLPGISEPPAFGSPPSPQSPHLHAQLSHADAPSSLIPSNLGMGDTMTPRSIQSVSPLALSDGLPQPSAVAHVREDPVPFDSLLDTPIPADFRFPNRNRNPPAAELRSNPDLHRLTEELALAKEEVRDLKGRLKIAKSLLVRNNDAQYTHASSSAPPAQSTMLAEPFGTGSQWTRPRDDIDELDGDSAKLALRNLLYSLSLPVSCVSALSSSDTHRQPAASVSSGPASVDQLQNVIQFVRDVDELVWKRQTLARYNGAVVPLNVFHVDNIQDLRDRVELWERAVRAPPL